MLRFAAGTLGVKRIELLDPVVTLFIESLAEEIYKLSTEIDNIESRMLDTLSGMLCSDISLSAHPAHCVLYAAPNESEFTLSKETPFILTNPRDLPEGQNELTFYPVCSTRIRKGAIRYIIHKGLCYKIDPFQTKTLMSRSRDSEFVDRESFWIALELDDSIKSLKDLSFYFDFSEITNKKEYLNMLPFMDWHLSGKKVSIKQGLHTIENNPEDEIAGLFNRFETAENIDQSIFNSYNKHFLSVTDDFDISAEKSAFPKELASYFQEHFTDNFTQPLVWLEIQYPPKFRAAIIEAMTVSINVFPIANKVLQTRTAKMNEFLPVVPLDTGNHEALLSIHSVTDLRGELYYDLPFEDAITKECRTYSLRKGGYERYSKRDLREYLLNLVHSLENHSSIKAGNSVGSNENMENALMQVELLIKQIKKVVLKTTERLEMQNYLLIDNLDENDIFFIKYWTTYCTQANGIKPHTALDCMSAEMSVDALSIYTLSPTMGGKYAPISSEQQNLRLKSLTENPVLVTNEDIIRYCKDNFSNLIGEVSIRKGIEECPQNKEFIRTTDVILTLRNNSEYNLDKNDTDNFKQLLQNKSPETYNYRVYINNKN